MTVLSLFSVSVNVINVNYMLRVHRILLFVLKNLNIEAFSSIFQVLIELQPLYMPQTNEYNWSEIYA